MTTNPIRHIRPRSFELCRVLITAAIAMIAGSAIPACSADRTPNSESNRQPSVAGADPAASLAPAALIDFRVLEAPPPEGDRSFASPTVLTERETADLLAGPDVTVLVSPRIKLLENFSGTVRVGTQARENAMLNGITLRARVVSVGDDRITLEVSGSENREGRRTVHLDATTVTIPNNAAAAVTMPDPERGRPRFLIVSAKPDRAQWPATMADAATNIMVHYGVSEVPADAALPATDIAPGRAVAVRHEVANAYLDRLTRVRGYRFISSPAVFTSPGDAATVSQIDTDKAGLQTDGHEMTVTVTTGSDKSFIVDMTARRRIADGWQPLFFADDLVLRPDQTLVYIEPARDGARTRTVLTAQASAYPAGHGPRQTAAELPKQTLKQTDSVDATPAR